MALQPGGTYLGSNSRNKCQNPGSLTVSNGCMSCVIKKHTASVIWFQSNDVRGITSPHLNASANVFEGGLEEALTFTVCFSDCRRASYTWRCMSRRWIHNFVAFPLYFTCFPHSLQNTTFHFLLSGSTNFPSLAGKQKWFHTALLEPSSSSSSVDITR